MNKVTSDKDSRAQKVPSTEYPTDATVPERVPGADGSRSRGVGDDREVRGEEARNQRSTLSTQQPPLGGERADNGSD